MDFNRAVKLILKHEGGWVQDENDPGGETKYGISKRAYPSLNIEELTKDDARAIYKRDYWDLCECDKMPYEAAIGLFDMAVNAGPVVAIRLLQRVVRVTDDGIIGPVTLKAVREAGDVSARYGAERLAYYAALRGWDRYGRGWSKRVIETAQEAAR